MRKWSVGLLQSKMLRKKHTKTKWIHFYWSEYLLWTCTKVLWDDVGGDVQVSLSFVCRPRRCRNQSWWLRVYNGGLHMDYNLYLYLIFEFFQAHLLPTHLSAMSRNNYAVQLPPFAPLTQKFRLIAQHDYQCPRHHSKGNINEIFQIDFIMMIFVLAERYVWHMMRRNPIVSLFTRSHNS